jgi:hypothetical protein
MNHQTKADNEKRGAQPPYHRNLIRYACGRREKATFPEIQRRNDAEGDRDNQP